MLLRRCTKSRFDLIRPNVRFRIEEKQMKQTQQLDDMTSQPDQHGYLENLWNASVSVTAQHSDGRIVRSQRDYRLI